MESTSARLRAAQASHNSLGRIYGSAIETLPQTTKDTIGYSSAAHRVMREDHQNIGIILDHLHDGILQAIKLRNELNSLLDEVDCETHREIADATLDQRDEIIAAGHARAVTLHAKYAAAVVEVHARTQALVAPIATKIVNNSRITAGSGTIAQELNSDSQDEADT
ncbi:MULTISPECIES: hypothetical protein [Mycobacterium avium complex (MAC)]|uniref:Uncharacterized protein n=2 Tax=Mycobacterium avium complex (MAC) TaxID=120793 RepID=A0AAW5S9Y4_MYCBC|nr:MULTISPECIES: hypothetical protein [Mycobacterium avium complex (MAC)]MBZ4537745.1 hypothetical protein [Mycobacterium avium subsp. hominissuis]MBZ4574895.1 hypothetical protein [Mycobacterium avium subsp. hominissuis]MBZ4581039.1 hypothetical protein [Mycobacterium avium subsp. hominissuis]MBZ4594891.1 hypothetical protein [Mycobacterium avium subsp. hominissuis]MBZ4608961.1 hypothetical protein [Mycobacterium avium subsp. hominissuis]